MPGFFMVDKNTDIEMLKHTLSQLPAVGGVDVFPCDSTGTQVVDSDAASALLVRCSGNSDFAKFACEQQGYADVLPSPWAPRGTA